MSLLTAAEKKPLRLIIRLHPTKMDLSSLTKLEDRHLTYILQRAPKLTELCLDDCTLLTSTSLDLLLGCENLEKVSLWNVDITPDFFQALWSKCYVAHGIGDWTDLTSLQPWTDKGSKMWMKEGCGRWRKKGCGRLNNNKK